MDGLWVIVGVIIILLLVLFLAYRALRNWQGLDNARRARGRSRGRRSRLGR